MLLRQIYNENLAQAAYLIGCQRTGEAIVVDPARDVDRYIDEAAAHGLGITAVAETHIHADYLSGGRELAERVGAKLYLSDEGDADWKYGWLAQRSGGGSYDHQLVKDGDTFKVGNIEFRVQHTPGHTPEHVSLMVTDLGGDADQPMGLLSGDFVFVGDLGRPDLLETAAGIAGVKEDAARTLGRSAARFLGLEDYLQVWPAHGAGSACGKALGAVPQTTVGYERRFNPALRLADKPEEFTEYILEGQPEPPLYFARMKTQNRDGAALLGALPEPRELTADEIRELDTQTTAVVDTRTWEAFREGHLAGSLFVPLGGQFHTVVGSYIQPEDSIVVIAESEDVENVVRELVRIGLDRVQGFVTPQALQASGAELQAASEVTPESIDESLLKDEMALLDVRRKAELGAGSIGDHALRFAHTRLPLHLDEIPKDRPLLVHCATGRRSAYAVAYLRRMGFDAVNLAGGFSEWNRVKSTPGNVAGADRA